MHIFYLFGGFLSCLIQESYPGACYKVKTTGTNQKRWMHYCLQLQSWPFLPLMEIRMQAVNRIGDTLCSCSRHRISCATHTCKWSDIVLLFIFLRSWGFLLLLLAAAGDHFRSQHVSYKYLKKKRKKFEDIKMEEQHIYTLVALVLCLLWIYRKLCIFTLVKLKQFLQGFFLVNSILLQGMVGEKTWETVTGKMRHIK